MRLLMVVGLLMGASGVALAEELPRYDPEAYCKEIAEFGGTYSATLFETCLKTEQKNYNQLKASWAELDGKARAHCDEIAQFGGGGSYQLLATCIKMETKAASKNTKFKF